MSKKEKERDKDGGEKERDTRDQLTRLKQKLFGVGISSQAQAPSSARSSISAPFSLMLGGGGQLPEGVTVLDLANEISSRQPMALRLRCLKEQCEYVKNTKLTQNEIDVLWQAAADLVQKQQPSEARQLGLLFMSGLIKNQYSRLNLMRSHFFATLRRHTVPDDFAYRLDAVRKLSKNGRDLTNFDSEFGKFLLEWLDEVQGRSEEGPKQMRELLILVYNTIKFNSNAVEENVMNSLIRFTCVLCNSAREVEDIQLSLDIFDVYVRYSFFSVAVLPAVVESLSRAVNIEKFCHTSWQIMKTVLKSDIGHVTIRTMCNVLECPENRPHWALVRGAVFFLGMACWGSQRIQSLQLSYLSIFPSLLACLAYDQPIVAYEVVLSISRLVKTYSTDLSTVEWDLVLDTLDYLQRYYDFREGDTGLRMKDSSFRVHLDSVLSFVQQLHVKCHFTGSERRLIELFDHYRHDRDESSVLLWLNYKAEMLHPSMEGWIEKAKQLMETYYKNEPRPKIRMKVLSIMASVLSTCRHMSEDALIKQVVFSNISDIAAAETDPEVRKMGIELLVDMAADTLDETHFDHILVILSKAAATCCPTNPHRHDTPTHTPQGERSVRKLSRLVADGRGLVDGRGLLEEFGIVGGDEEARPAVEEMHVPVPLHTAYVAVCGLVALFQKKLLLLPTSHALKVMDVILKNLHLQFKTDLFSPVANACRQEMVGLLMRIRANREYHIYLTQDDHPDKETTETVIPSPFIHCQKRREADSRPSMPLGQASGGAEPITHCASLPYVGIYDTLRTILSTETQWEIYLRVVQGIIPMLRNKYLIVGSETDPSKLCALLCDLIMKDKLASNVFEIPLGRSRSELYYHAYHALVILVSYHTSFSRSLKDELLMCFKKGLASKWRDLARPCVYALRLCALELQQQITRFLPGILTDLNKVSFKHTMAIPILEFLSGLIRTPPLYANFTEDHYKLIFGLVLYYTDYIKYPPYIVSLAYHVISVWFIRCRLSYRKKFAPFILNGLMLNRPMAEENLEACLDMLSRYTYASCNTDPRRGEIAVHRTTGTVAWLFRCLNRQYTRPGDLFTSVPGLMAFLKRETKFPPCPEVEIKPLLPMPLSADPQAHTQEHPQEEEEQNFTVSNPHQPELESPQPGEPAIDYTDADKVAAAIAAGDIDFPSVIVGRMPLRRISIQQDPINLGTGGSVRPRSLSTGSIPVPSPNQSLGIEIPDAGAKLRVPSLGPPMTRGIDDFGLDRPSESTNLQQFGGVSSGIVSELPKLQDIQSGKELDIASCAPIQPPADKLTQELQPTVHFEPAGPTPQPETEISRSETPIPQESSLLQKQETPATPIAPGEHTQTVPPVPPLNSQNEKSAISGDRPEDEKAEEKEVVDGDGGARRELLSTKSSPAIMLDRPTQSEEALPQKSSSLQPRRFVAPSSVFFPPLLSYEGAGDQASQLIMSPGFWDVSSNRFATDSDDSDTEGELRATPSKYVPNIRSRHNSASTSSPHALITLSLDEQMALHSRTGTDEDTVVLEPSDGGGSIVVGVGVNVLKAPDLEHVTLVPKEHTAVYSPRSHVHRRSRLSIEGTLDSEDPDPTTSQTHEWVPARDISLSRFESVHAQPTLEVVSEQPKIDSFNPPSGTKREPPPHSHVVPEMTVVKPENEPLPTGQNEPGQSPTPLPNTTGPALSPAPAKHTLVKQTTTAPPKVPLPSLHPTAPGTQTGPNQASNSGPNTPNPTHENTHGRGSVPPLASSTGVRTAPTTPTLQPLPTLEHLADVATPSTLSLPAEGAHAISEDEKHRRKSTGCAVVGSVQMQSSTTTAPSSPPAARSPSATVYASPLVQKQARNSVPLVGPGGSNAGLNPPAHRTSTPTLTTPTPTGRGSPTDVPGQPGQRQSLVSQKQEEGARDPKSDWQLPDPTNNEMLSSFLMVQLYQLPSPPNPPLPIKTEEQASYERAMRVLQKIPTRDTHKIGVVYVGEGQASGDEILRNEHGSVRYVEFLSRLGTLTRLKGTDVYTGGLDREDNMDGEFAYHWQDDITEVIFHVATLMPHNDPSCLVKKRHIGNDYVTLVYNDSKKPYNLHAIKGQFNFVDVIIQPLEDGTNEVLIRTKEVMQTYVPEKFDEIVSEASLGSFVRNIAIHANLASLIQHLGTGYVTNWVERLRSIKRIGERMVQPLAPAAPNDFTAFT